MKNKLFYILFSLITTAASAQQGINYAGGASTKLDYTLLNLSDGDSQIKGSKYLTGGSLLQKRLWAQYYQNEFEIVW